MVLCSFCESEIPKGCGMQYVKKTGAMSTFCSSKCKKNALNLKREGRRQKWTPAAKRFAELQGKRKKKAESAKKKGEKKK